MRKQRLEPTLVQKTILTVDGFDKVFIRLNQQVILRGQSKSTLNNYIRRIESLAARRGPSRSSTSLERRAATKESLFTASPCFDWRFSVIIF